MQINMILLWGAREGIAGLVDSSLFLFFFSRFSFLSSMGCCPPVCEA